MNPVAVLTDLEQACKDAALAVVESPAVAADIQQIIQDLVGNVSKPSGLFNALPILARLQLTNRDKADPTLTALKANGTVIQQIITLIQSGISDLPAILAALQAAGITVPSWMNVIIEILIALVPVTPTT